MHADLHTYILRTYIPSIPLPRKPRHQRNKHTSENIMPRNLYHLSIYTHTKVPRHRCYIHTLLPILRNVYGYASRVVSPAEPWGEDLWLSEHGTMVSYYTYLLISIYSSIFSLLWSIPTFLHTYIVYTYTTVLYNTLYCTVLYPGTSRDLTPKNIISMVPRRHVCRYFTQHCLSETYNITPNQLHST